MTHAFPTRLSSDLLDRIGAAAPLADYAPDFNSRLKREAEAVMRHVEKHQPAIRALMHEYGVAPVTALLSVGIKKPRTIRHIIEVCRGNRSEEHTSELQSLMRTSYAVFCLIKNKTSTYSHTAQSTNHSTNH